MSILIDNLDVFGDKEQGYGATLRNVSGEVVGLNPCAFCGGHQQEILNTHTPEYWIECSCGVSLENSYKDSSGHPWSDLVVEDTFSNKSDCIAKHQEAFDYIINKWQKLTHKNNKGDKNE